jgi:hypothetical protein
MHSQNTRQTKFDTMTREAKFDFWSNIFFESPAGTLARNNETKFGPIIALEPPPNRLPATPFAPPPSPGDPGRLRRALAPPTIASAPYPTPLSVALRGTTESQKDHKPYSPKIPAFPLRRRSPACPLCRSLISHTTAPSFPPPSFTASDPRPPLPHQINAAATASLIRDPPPHPR